MCLYTKQICPQRARKDIVCYKKFFIWKSFLQTSYRFYRIVKPKENHPTLMDDTNIPVSILRNYLPYIKGVSRNIKCQIGRGMIHAYKTKPAFADKKVFSYPTIGLYKCVIPKGTLYYIGIDNDICAKQMLVIEEVNPNTAG